ANCAIELALDECDLEEVLIYTLGQEMEGYSAGMLKQDASGLPHVLLYVVQVSEEGDPMALVLR
ncbi:hypothetical protein ACJX0J_036069, partial [Zea mays]